MSIWKEEKDYISFLFDKDQYSEEMLRGIFHYMPVFICNKSRPLR